MNDLISRQEAIEALSFGKEVLSRVLDDTDVVGTDREKYSWGLGLIESSIKDIEELPSAQPEIILCRDCKHFYLDKPYVIQGVPVLGHEVCDAWGDGCKTSQDGYCFLAERRTE